MPKIATADRENVQMIFGSLEYLVRILFRCDIYEKLYAELGLEATEQLNSSLVNLYVAVLEYLSSARRQIRLKTAGNSRDQKKEIEKPRLIIHLVRILKSILSDSGELYRKIQECEKDVQNDADIAEKEGLNHPPRYSSSAGSHSLTVQYAMQLPVWKVMV